MNFADDPDARGTNYLKHLTEGFAGLPEVPVLGRASAALAYRLRYVVAEGELIEPVLQAFAAQVVDFVPGAVDEIVRLAEDFALRVRGVDKPIDLQRVRRNRR